MQRYFYSRVIERREQDMRGGDIQTAGLFSHVSCEAPVPASHSPWAISATVDDVLEVLSPDFKGRWY